MREIKFRAWDGQFMINPFCELRDNQFWGEDLTNTPYQTPIAVMQFVTAQENEQVEFFEDDVVKLQRLPDGRCSADDLFQIIYYHGSFVLACLPRKIRIYPIAQFNVDDLILVGNAYQNPELIREMAQGK